MFRKRKGKILKQRKNKNNRFNTFFQKYFIEVAKDNGLAVTNEPRTE